MKYNHMVKYNGVYYPTGTDVPVGEAPVEELKAVKEEKPLIADEVVSERSKRGRKPNAR